MADPRSKIINKLRNASTESFRKNIQPPEEVQQSFFPAFEKPLIEHFREEFEAVNGQFHYCENLTELKEQLAALQSQINSPFFCKDEKIASLLSDTVTLTDNATDFENMQAAITPCQYLVARTGSIVASSQTQSGRRLLVYPPIHIVIAYANQLVGEISQAIDALVQQNTNLPPSLITTITGPSRTADIEKTLILGAMVLKNCMYFL